MEAARMLHYAHFDAKGGLQTFSASAKSHGAAEEADIQVIIKTRSFLHRRKAALSPLWTSMLQAEFGAKTGKKAFGSGNTKICSGSLLNGQT